MKIKTVAVLGAGAVGSYVIWGLSNRKDIRLGVIVEGERAERMKKGCIINGITYHRKYGPAGSKWDRSVTCGFKIRGITGCIGEHPHDHRRTYHCYESYERRRQ